MSCMQSNLYQREKELDELKDSYRKCLDEGIQFLFVKGCAGSGKTELIKRFLSDLDELGRTRPITALGRAGYLFDAANPYLLVHKVAVDLVSSDKKYGDKKVKKIAASFMELAPAWLEAIPVAGQVASAFVQTVNYFSAEPTKSAVPLEIQFKSLLQELSKENGLVLVADDAQWADKSSLTLLAGLCEDLRKEKILVIFSYRDDEVASQEDGENSNSLKKLAPMINRYTDIKYLELPPLSVRSVELILQDKLSLQEKEIGNAPAFLPTKIQKLSEGNPLFVHEIADYLVSRATHTLGLMEAYEDFKSQGSFTDRMRAVFDVKLEALAKENRRLLEKCSFLGYEFAPELIEIFESDSRPDVWDLLDQILETNYFLLPVKNAEHEDRYQFSNTRLADYLAGCTKKNPHTWKRTHKRIAGYLSSKTPPGNDPKSINKYSQVAYHYELAGDREKAAPYIVAAAKAAFNGKGYHEVCLLVSKLADNDFLCAQEVWAEFFKSALWISEFPLAVKKWKTISQGVDIPADTILYAARSHRMMNLWDDCVTICDTVSEGSASVDLLAEKEMLLGEVKLCGVPQLLNEAVEHFRNVEYLVPENEYITYRAAGHQGLALLCERNITAALDNLNRAVLLAQKTKDPFNIYESIHWLSKAQLATLDLEGAKASIEKTSSIADKEQVHKNNPYHFRDFSRTLGLLADTQASVEAMRVYVKALSDSKEWHDGDYAFETWASMIALQIFEIRILRGTEYAQRFVASFQETIFSNINLKDSRQNLVETVLSEALNARSIESLRTSVELSLPPSIFFDAEQVFTFNIEDFWETRNVSH
ncbi:ATP-binding protein [Dermabacteraceae bacterium P13101]